MAAAINALLTDPARAADLAGQGHALGDKYSPAAMCRAYEALLTA